MNINRDNYEAIFLDFIEGRLSSSEEELLQRFLQFNPDLEEELNSFELHEFSAERVTFSGKDSLKKEMPEDGNGVTDSNFDMYCIAYIEGDLDQEQRQVFEQYLDDHPERAVELTAYRTTIIQPAEVQFPKKAQLKHRELRPVNWRILLPVAAAAAIAAILFIGIPEQNTPMEIASTTAPDDSEKKPENAQPESKPETKPAQATFNMIKKTNVPVPVSDYKERQQDQKEKQMEKMAEMQQNTQEAPVIASVNLRNQRLEALNVSYDRIELQSIEPPMINSSSLSILELARYQAHKATKIMEEEDALLWSIASSGLKELNRITGPNTELIASRDEDGSISGFRFRSRFLNVSAPLPWNE